MVEIGGRNLEIEKRRDERPVQLELRDDILAIGVRNLDVDGRSGAVEPQRKLLLVLAHRLTLVWPELPGLSLVFCTPSDKESNIAIVRDPYRARSVKLISDAGSASLCPSRKHRN